MDIKREEIIEEYRIIDDKIFIYFFDGSIKGVDNNSLNLKILQNKMEEQSSSLAFAYDTNRVDIVERLDDLCIHIKYKKLITLILAAFAALNGNVPLILLIIIISGSLIIRDKYEENNLTSILDECEKHYYYQLNKKQIDKYNNKEKENAKLNLNTIDDYSLDEVINKILEIKADEEVNKEEIEENNKIKVKKWVDKINQ